MKITLSIFCLLLPLICPAQNEANHWYFGEQAGLDFSSGSPVFDNNNPMFTPQGCASLSDESGNLLFYANSGDLSWGSSGDWDGVVMNRNHEVMANGYLGDTCGEGATNQSSLILPKVGTLDQYYLFTVDDINSLNKGFRYTVIDMSLDGGNGRVIEKGIPILDSLGIGMAATKHANDEDYWVVVKKHLPNMPLVAYYAYEINSLGIMPPVISLENALNSDIFATYSTCKLSPNGRLLYSGHGVYDFSNSTGTIDGYRSIKSNQFYDYGEFSDNSSVLYAYYMGSSGFKIEQFDLTADDIESSATYVDTGFTFTNCPAHGGMQLGPDGKIYVSFLFYRVSIIHSPNTLGIGCNFEAEALYLDGQNSKFEFPNFSSHYFNFNPPVTSITDQTISLSQFKIYPNPTSNSSIVKFESSEHEKQFELYDATGRLVMSEYNILGDKFTFAVDHLTPGLYYVRTFANGETLGTERLVINR